MCSKRWKSLAFSAIKLAIDKDPGNDYAHLVKGILLLTSGDLEEAKKALQTSLDLNRKIADTHKYLSILYCLRSEKEKSIKSIEEAMIHGLKFRDDMALVAILKKSDFRSLVSNQVLKHKENKSAQRKFPKIMELKVQDGLAESLYELESIDLQKRDLPTNGNAKTSNFSFFEDNPQLTKSLQLKLEQIAEEAVGTEVFFSDSWYTILRNGGSVKKHRHLSSFAGIKNFSIEHKHYALVYYLDVGDQECEEPGFLRFYEPDFTLLPSRGMVVIFPSNRMHSVSYKGNKDRIMIGVNFWSI